jgi:hypothetical protein
MACASHQACALPTVPRAFDPRNAAHALCLGELPLLHRTLGPRLVSTRHPHQAPGFVSAGTPHPARRPRVVTARTLGPFAALSLLPPCRSQCPRSGTYRSGYSRRYSDPRTTTCRRPRTRSEGVSRRTLTSDFPLPAALSAAHGRVLTPRAFGPTTTPSDDGPYQWHGRPWLASAYPSLPGRGLSGAHPLSRHCCRYRMPRCGLSDLIFSTRLSGACR